MPKRVNNIFKENITFTKLLEAHNKCKKNKRLKKQVIEFEMKLESNLIQIGKELLNNTYTFSEYFEFTIYEPKERKIKTLNYKDRVVQTWYVENFLKPYFKPNFVNDSYACIETKGTHDYLAVLEKLGRPAPPIDERLEHILITGMFNTFFELIIHEMPLEEAKHYLKEMRAFYTAGWMKIMGQ